jgi:hypothetical protein
LNRDELITQCQVWVDEFIVRLGICPFAKAVLDKQQLGWWIIEEQPLEDQLLALMGQVQSLLEQGEPETMLIILPTYQHQWLDFLTLVECANQLLQDHGLLRDIQIASFHPEYQFEGEAEDSASHFTNRSPWPMLHLIRQDSISRALANYPDPESIPERNIRLMKQIGSKKLQQQLDDYQRQSSC